MGDYIAFILPISQYNNDIKLYEFSLRHSEDLGVQKYSGRSVHCCLNIYKRPKGDVLNSRPNYNLKDVEIKEAVKNQNSKRNRVIRKEDFNYDLRIMVWGKGKISEGKRLGCEVDYPRQYAKEFCIKVNNKEYKDDVLNLLKTTHWEDIYPMTATPNLLQWQVYKYLKEQIPELE